MRNITLALSLLLCALVPAAAQDPVFSQFFAAPLQVNPAFTGVTATPRITLNYRNQYPGLPNAYATYAAAYEQSIEGLNSGLGVMVMADVAGDGVYKVNRASLFYSYEVRINRETGIKIGVEGTLMQTSVDWNRLVFGDQLNPITGAVDGGGNPNPSEEIQPESLSRSVFDVSAGILFYSRRFHAGLSLKHLNTPDESLLGINENLNVGLPMRSTLHLGYEIPLSGGNKRQGGAFISPNLMLVKQGDFGQINGGAYAGFGSFFAGAWYRHAISNPDAVIALVGLRTGVLRLGYSYDLTISDLAAAPGGLGGAHEISMTINFDNTERSRKKRRDNRYNDCFGMFR